jgi:hypothetical protein
MLQKWQAYNRYRHTYDATWRATIEKVWADYKSQWEAENPGVEIPRNKHFTVTNEYIMKEFQEETPEKIQEVEEYRRQLKDEADEVPDEDQNANYQTYVMIPTQVSSSLIPYTVE